MHNLEQLLIRGKFGVVVLRKLFCLGKILGYELFLRTPPA